jgi:hypothetical protein
LRIRWIDTILANRWVELAIISSMILVVSMIFFTPDQVFIKKLTAHAFEAVLLFLASAIVFMILRKPRIMFTCLAMAMVLSLYLKQTSRSGLQSFFENERREFSVCQILINSGADQYEDIAKRIAESNASIIQIQEITPDWQQVLSSSLAVTYPYIAELIRIDPYGLMIFSKFPIRKIDTLLYTDTATRYQIPALRLVIEILGQEVEYLACHLLPRLNTNDFNKVQGFFDLLLPWVENSKNKHIMISGELGLTPWDYVLQKFLTESGLELSRREPHLFVQPFEHIIYSKSMTCRKLKEVVTRDRLHLGVEGIYTFSQVE